MKRLISYEINPPGRFLYEQPPPKPHRFPVVPMIEDLARQVSAYRSANGLERSSFIESLQDVDTYTCQRLGGNPRFCSERGDDPNALNVALAQNAPGVTKCAGCGAPVT